MPRKAVQKALPGVSRSPIGSRKPTQKAEWVGFVQCDVNGPEREGFDDWLSTNAQHVNGMLVDAMASGLKFTMVWDGSNECYIASFTGRPQLLGEQDWNATLSARSDDFATVLALLVYKHYEVCGEDWEDWLINGSKTKRNFG